MARTDYAASAGTRPFCTGTGSIDSLAKGDAFSIDDWKGFSDGVVYQWSEVKLCDITDGTSHTYLVGESYLCPDNYFNGLDISSNENMYVGDDRDSLRNSNSSSPPMPDTPGLTNLYSFGSAHMSGWNIALCDGSVHTMSYSIDIDVHTYLGCRNDGNVIDDKNF